MRVADASVVAALLFGEPRGAEASERLAGQDLAAWIANFIWGIADDELRAATHESVGIEYEILV